jgi:predicted nucleotide-binding protein
MAKKSIFIGSAIEAKEIAAVIARALAEADYRPLRWWEQFPPGSVTLDRLRDVALREADGAILLLTKVDKMWYRENSSETPRDNAVLEYGLFVSALGRERTIILTDGARLPTDVGGIAVAKLVEDDTGAAERMVKHFN